MKDATPLQLATVLKKMREARLKLQNEIDAIEEQEETVMSAVLEKMKEEGVDSYKTEYGTLTRNLKERYWPMDWKVFNDYILEHGEIGLLEQRVHQSNMKAWIAAHPNDFPPSLNVDRKYTVTLYKPRKKGEVE